MEHPTVTNINKFGYPKRQRFYGKDNLGNDVMVGDEILALDDKFYLASILGSHATEILIDLGATYRFAK